MGSAGLVRASPRALHRNGSLSGLGGFGSAWVRCFAGTVLLVDLNPRLVRPWCTVFSAGTSAARASLAPSEELQQAEFHKFQVF